MNERSLSSDETEVGFELLCKDGVKRVQYELQQIIRNGSSTYSSLMTPTQDPYLDWYITYLDTKLQSIGPTLKSTFYDSNSTTAEVEITTTVKFYQILSCVARELTSNEILPTMNELQESVSQQYFRYSHDNKAVIQILFIAIGLLTMLYEPELDPAGNTVRVLRPQYVSGLPIATETITRYAYSLKDISDLQTHQLLNSFGRLIPGSLAWAQNIPTPVEADIFLEQVVVSYLNFHTLSKVAKIQIVFVDSLSLHLELDEKAKMLKVFRFPSYCRLLCSEYSRGSSKDFPPIATYLSR